MRAIIVKTRLSPAVHRNPTIYAKPADLNEERRINWYTLTRSPPPPFVARRLN